MSLSLQMNSARREYTVRAWQRAFYILVGIGLLAVGIFLFTVTGSASDRLLISLVSAVFPAMGIYMLAWATRARLVIDGDRIEVRGAFQERSARIDEIEGFRTISSRNGAYKQLRLKDGRQQHHTVRVTMPPTTITRHGCSSSPISTSATATRCSTKSPTNPSLAPRPESGSRPCPAPKPGASPPSLSQALPLRR